MQHLQKILVGTDFSKGSARAAARAAILAIEHGAAIHLLHAHFAPTAAVLQGLGIRQSTAKQVRSAAKQHLKSEAEALRLHGIAVTEELMDGEATACIQRALESFGADLVVVGAQGRRSVRNVLLGTTAQRVNDRLPTNVLAVRAPARSPYANVLVCLDADDTAIPVLTSAAALFPNAHLRVAHAYEPLFEGKLRFAGAAESAIRQHREESGQEARRTISDLVSRSGVPIRRSDVIVRHGFPAHVILKLARRFKSEVIVLGAARSAFAAYFLGSVSRQILREAPCDVALLGRGRT